MSIALYRRYRPETFQEVIGQSHVTEPLMAALGAGRTTHAYLFSGPRGCGKTTSARILARCLNCVEYPTDTPCGTCDSCVELARDGSGSLDVVELDAASHGGVDDARELREQAGFAPVRDRFKIFIIDEAHMVSNQGFNALLKVVEEPPEHVKFIFATTEPEKVIGTIRSRTHHYPFRLVPPAELEDYLAKICAEEGVEASREVLALAVRAGTGSVRDTLSVLDQLIGGSTNGVVDYDRAIALLGYTSANLLDEAIGAIAQRDGAALFGVVDSVVKSGHDPRRFVEDLLQRLRDLVIITLAGQGAQDVFVSVPDDQYARMREQAEELGAQRASRCADLTNEALNHMQGATAPRLQLELLCARLVVDEGPAPAAAPERSSKPAAMPAGLDKWKKQSPAQAASAHQQPVSAPQQTAPAAQQQGAPGRPSHNPNTVAPEHRPMPALPSDPAPADPAATQAEGAPQQAEPVAEQAQQKTARNEPDEPRGVQPEEASAELHPVATDHPQVHEAQSMPAAAGSAGFDLDALSSRWSEIVADVKNVSRVAGSQLEQSSGPMSFDGSHLVLGFEQPGLAKAFGRHAGAVSESIQRLFGENVTVDGQVGSPSMGTPSPDAPKVEAAQDAAAQPNPAPASGVRTTPKPAAQAEQGAVAEPLHPDSEPGSDPYPASDPYGDFDEPAEPELDPVYGYQQDDSGDPAGVLGPLLDGTVVFHGEDNTSAHTAPADAEASGDEHVSESTKGKDASGGESSGMMDSVAATTTAPEHAETEPVETRPAQPDPTPSQAPGTPFYAQDMPSVPPMEPPSNLPGSMTSGRTAPAGSPSFAVPPASFPGAPPPATPSAGEEAASIADHVREQREQEQREQPAPTSNAGAPREPVTLDDWDEVSADDPEITTTGKVGLQVAIEHFNAQIIDEFNHEDGN